MVGLDDRVQGRDPHAGHAVGARAVVEVGGGRHASQPRWGLFSGSAVALIAVYAVVHGRAVVSLPIALVLAAHTLWRERRRPTRLVLLDGFLELSRHSGQAPERLRLDDLEEVGAGIEARGRSVWIRRARGQREVLLKGLDEDEAGLVLSMLGGQPTPRPAPRRSKGGPSKAWAVVGGAVAGAGLLVVTERAHRELQGPLWTHVERGETATDCVAPQVAARVPAEGSGERAGEKQRYATATVSTDRLLVHFDPRMADVVVPHDVSAFRDTAVGVIEVGHDLPRPITDLRLDEHGVRATLSFGEQGLRWVDIPWAAVFALAPSSSAAGRVFPSDVPPECIDAYVP